MSSSLEEGMLLGFVKYNFNALNASFNSFSLLGRMSLQLSLGDVDGRLRFLCLSLDSLATNYLLLVCIRVALEDWTRVDTGQRRSADYHEHPRDFGEVGWAIWYY